MKSYILSLGVAMKSMFLSNAILNTVDDGVDLAKDFKNEFIEGREIKRPVIGYGQRADNGQRADSRVKDSIEPDALRA